MPRRVGISISTGLTIFPMWGKSYAMQLSASAAIAVVLIAASGVLVWSRDAERRNGARIVIRELCANIVAHIKRLSRLRGREVSSKKTLVLFSNLRVLRSDLLRSETLIDATETAVHCINDVPRRVLHSVAGIAGLRRHVIPHLGDSRPVLAAALLGLHLHGVKLLHQRRLLVAAGKLGLCKAVCHRHVGAVISTHAPAGGATAIFHKSVMRFCGKLPKDDTVLCLASFGFPGRDPKAVYLAWISCANLPQKCVREGLALKDQGTSCFHEGLASHAFDPVLV